MKEEKTQGNNERKEELGREGEEEKREGRTIGITKSKEGKKERQEEPCFKEDTKAGKGLYNDSKKKQTIGHMIHQVIREEAYREGRMKETGKSRFGVPPSLPRKVAAW